MYVKQLIYGRLVYFTFESKVSSTELSAALNFAFNGAAQVDASAALDFSQILSETTIKGYVIGGSASADISSLLGNSITNVQEFIQDNTLFPADNFNNFGDIIGFKLAYLSDGSTAALSFGGTTTIRECLRARQKVDVELMGIEAISDGIEIGNDLEIYHRISAVGNGSPVFLFNRADANRITIPIGDAFGATQTELNNQNLSNIGFGQVTVDLDSNLQLRVDLREFDGGSGDEILQQTSTFTPAQGLRGTKTVQAIAGGTQANVHFRLTPVF
jgi:hypothetical protein